MAWVKTRRDGDRYGCLVQVGDYARGTGTRFKCDCGEEYKTCSPHDGVYKGSKLDCGCGISGRKHYSTNGLRKLSQKAYKKWSRIMDKCYKPTDPLYYLYGGRGIKVCDRWKDDAMAFYEDMGGKESFDGWWVLMRHDEYRDFSPQNCYRGSRWKMPLL
jgi:hypothetical protein